MLAARHPGMGRIDFASVADLVLNQLLLILGEPIKRLPLASDLATESWKSQ